MAMSLKERAKQRASGPVRRLGKGESVELRFLHEMSDEDGWRYLASGYDTETRRSTFYESDEDVPKGMTTRENYLALAYDTDTDSVDVWELRKTIVIQLIEVEEEYGTITDRNYRLKRRGEGPNDTKYTAVPMGESEFTKKMIKAKKANESKLNDAVERLLSFDN